LSRSNPAWAIHLARIIIQQAAVKALIAPQHDPNQREWKQETQKKNLTSNPSLLNKLQTSRISNESLARTRSSFIVSRRLCSPVKRTLKL
jgi:hypothetical protein